MIFYYISKQCLLPGGPTSRGRLQPWLRLKTASGFSQPCIVMLALCKNLFCFFFLVKCLNPPTQKKKHHPDVCTQKLLVGWINAPVCHLTWASLVGRSYLLSHSSELNCIRRPEQTLFILEWLAAALKKLNNFRLHCAHCCMKCGNKALRST